MNETPDTPEPRDVMPLAPREGATVTLAIGVSSAERHVYVRNLSINSDATPENVNKFEETMMYALHKFQLSVFGFEMETITPSMIDPDPGEGIPPCQ